MSSRIGGVGRPPYPRQMILDVHSYCNAKCSMCPYDFLKTNNPMGKMREDLFKKIIDDFSNVGAVNGFRGRVLFCNMGELFLYREVIARIEYLLASGLELNIQTNASSLSPRKVDQLLDSGFNGSVLISFHGISPEVYRTNMGLDISKTLRNVDYLIERYPKSKISIQAIPYRWPRGEARRVRRFWRQRGIAVRMPIPNSRAGLLPVIANKNRRTLVGCSADRPLGEMVIMFDGDVVLCCNDMARQEVVGNLRHNTIEEVWTGEPFLDRVDKIYGGKASNSDFICRKCEFGKVSHSIIRRLGKNIYNQSRKFFLARVW